ncbi:hypothetical protein ACFFIF_10880 [Vagococcus entomophilus]|uniref:Uncharacterized protein n=1 Tax=Vagococcus entomophilus TaxID=1160095 RepID=A0A430AF33_9ENTE|nr:hypothetical protein [Vagococcus entomophilus]RSU06191.1 hypothetical protein CBF30_10770 [Vagococcus entomophilus]
MENLRIKLKIKDNPYKDESSALLELWGEFTLHYGDVSLLSLEWDVSSFIEWFAEKKEYLKVESFPFPFTNSIAESRDLLFDKMDDFSDLQEQFDYEDYLSDYFENHHFHLRGTKTPEFYMGLSPNDCGEISYYDDSQYNVYSFDMDEFLGEADKEIKQFLSTVTIKRKNKSYFEDTLGKYYSYIKLV